MCEKKHDEILILESDPDIEVDMSKQVNISYYHSFNDQRRSLINIQPLANETIGLRKQIQPLAVNVESFINSNF